jgi:hypothetical protein
VSKEDLIAVCNNEVPKTGKRLTARTNDIPHEPVIDKETGQPVKWGIGIVPVRAAEAFVKSARFLRNPQKSGRVNVIWTRLRRIFDLTNSEFQAVEQSERARETIFLFVRESILLIAAIVCTDSNHAIGMWTIVGNIKRCQRTAESRDSFW